MPKRETMTRAKKIAAAAKSGESKKPTAPRRQGATKPAEQQPEATVTSMVARAGKPKLVACYAQLVAHRKPVVDKVKAAIAAIAKSYADHRKDDRAARDERHDLADETLDYLINRFDHNGFSNPGDRLVFSWLMFDLLGPIGHRTEEVCNLVEKTFALRGQALSGNGGLGSEIKKRREAQQKRRDNTGNRKVA